MSEEIEDKILTGNPIWKDYHLEVYKKVVTKTSTITITIDGEMWRTYDVVHGAFVRVTIEDKTDVKRSDLEQKQYELEETVTELSKVAK